MNDVLTLAPALAAELEGVPLATLVPHFYPPTADGRAALRARRDGRAHAARPQLLARHRAADEPRRRARPPRAERDAPAGRPARRWSDTYGGISERLCIVGTFPQLEYPRVWPAGVHVTGPADLAAARRRVRVAGRARGRACWSRRAPRRTPARPSCARRCAGSRRCRCACSRCAVAGTTGLPPAPNARVVEWVSYENGDAAGRPGRLPRGARDARDRAREGRARRDRAGGRRHGRERGARAVGGRRPQPAGALPVGRRRCAGSSSGRSSARGYAPARSELAGWARTHDGAETAAKLVERFAAGAES